MIDCPPNRPYESPWSGLYIIELQLQSSGLSLGPPGLHLFRGKEDSANVEGARTSHRESTFFHCDGGERGQQQQEEEQHREREGEARSNPSAEGPILRRRKEFSSLLCARPLLDTMRMVK